MGRQKGYKHTDATKIKLKTAAKNRPPVTQEIRDKISKYQKDHPRPAWNKGLTKETDLRVKKNVESKIGYKRLKESIDRGRQTRKRNKELGISKPIIRTKEWNDKIGNSNKGKSISPKQKELISKRHKGKTITKEHRLAISNGNKNKIVSLETREKIRKHKMGHVVTKETRDKISKKNRGRKQSLKTTEKRASSLEKLFKNSKYRSNPELKVEEILKKYNMNYIIQKRIEDKLFDFYIPRFNTLLEIDGIYWHSKNILTEHLTGSRLYDRYNDYHKDKLAQERGHNLLRIWEDELNKLEEYIKTMWLPLL